MYNFTMKKGIENILKKYWYYIILFIITVILLLVSCYVEKRDISLYYINNRLELKDSLYQKNNEYYISYDDLKANFSENIFYDKISKKLIVTTWDNVVKIESKYAVKYEDKLWFNIKYLADNFGFDVLNCDRNIYILNDEYIDAKAKEYRLELYSVTGNQVIDVITNNKDVSLKVIADENVENTNIWVNVVVSNKEKIQVGRVLKEKVEYTYEDIEKEEIKEEEINPQVIVYVKDTLSSNTDITKITGISESLLRLSGEDTVTKNKVTRYLGYTKDIYAVYTNGYIYSNFDTDVLTYMLNSDENKEKTIKEVVDFVQKNELAGIVLDFKNFKSSDKDLLTEYIKELGVNLHKENKKLYVNVENITSIDIKNIENFVDYIIVKAYGERTLHSKTFGAYSSVTYVDNMVSNILDLGVKAKKIILEISPNSLLFTIRAGTIIDTELYNMSAVSEYIKLNNLEVIKDNTNKMNYIDFKKGITSYKMWIEDESSIKEKLNIVTKNSMAGVSINKSGDEIKSIYDLIEKSLEVAK